MPPLLAAAAVAAVGAVGVALGVTTIGAVALGVAATVVTSGVSYLMAPNTGTARGVVTRSATEPTVSQSNAQRSIPVAQPIPPRRFVYGPVRTAGVLFFQDNANPYLFVCVALSDGEIGGVDAVYFGDDAVPLGSNGEPPAGNRFFGKLKVETTTGADGQEVSPLLLSAFPARIGAAFRQRGVARAVARLDWGTDAEQHNALWGDAITPTYQMRGMKVYDPRDAAQDIDDTTTWAYSANPALCVAHAITHAWGVALDFDSVDWNSVATAADVCDEPVSYGGADVPMFRCGGIFEAGTEFGAQLADMLSSFGGIIGRKEGKYFLLADAPGESVWTIEDSDIIELGEFQFASETAKLFNAVSAIYYSDSEQGRRTSTPVYEIASAVVAEGLRETSVTLPFTADAHSAQILAYRELLGTRDGRLFSVRLTDAAADLLPGDVVTFATTQATFLNGAYRVTQVDIADEGVFVFLRGYNPDVYISPATYLV